LVDRIGDAKLVFPDPKFLQNSIHPSFTSGKAREVGFIQGKDGLGLVKRPLEAYPVLLASGDPSLRGTYKPFFYK